MFPLKDDIPSQSFPLVTIALIVVNVLVYLYEFFLGFPPGASRAASLAAERAYEGFVYEFGLVPCRLSGTCPVRLATALAGAPAPWLTIFTSMFVHGGLFHVGGNMLYLWIFGDNVEDSMGKGRFVAFYLLCGVAAAGAQYLSDPRSAVPMIGASGAVSGLPDPLSSRAGVDARHLRLLLAVHSHSRHDRPGLLDRGPGGQRAGHLR